MKIAVWDTYVKRTNGLLMHFDILVSDTLKNKNIVLEYGKKYLASKPFETLDLTSEECRFCHINQASWEITEKIKAYGYAIIEMENCE
ncbi:DUF2024 family protein [Aquimarina gracilis]|uniref:DUF2024 family protein n=1 Tax=Aquimarina gracilis TaxID=874422 RepID=A0ABU5ZYE3_9FLAO|nr:DUF2024 family protein [Aquimarina gracilis]MEB3346909.1 DUF2024 family protein [Aquimarina gracilis]